MKKFMLKYPFKTHCILWTACSGNDNIQIFKKKQLLPGFYHYALSEPWISPCITEEEHNTLWSTTGNLSKTLHSWYGPGTKWSKWHLHYHIVHNQMLFYNYCERSLLQLQSIKLQSLWLQKLVELYTQRNKAVLKQTHIKDTRSFTHWMFLPFQKEAYESLPCYSLESNSPFCHFSCFSLHDEIKFPPLDL